MTAARNSAQLLANSMEILGDAQPNQANYDQVLNTFNVNNAISSLQRAVAKVQSRPRLNGGAAPRRNRTSGRADGDREVLGDLGARRDHDLLGR